MSSRDKVFSHVLVRAKDAARLPEETRLEIRDALLNHFKQGRFDAGLASAVAPMEQSLTAPSHDRANGHVPAAPVPGRRAGNVHGARFGVGTLLHDRPGHLRRADLAQGARRSFRSLRRRLPSPMGMGGMPRPGMGPGPGYGPQGYGGGTAAPEAVASSRGCSEAWAVPLPATGSTTSSPAGTARRARPMLVLTCPPRAPRLMIPRAMPRWVPMTTAAWEPRGDDTAQPIPAAIGAAATAAATGAVAAATGAVAAATAVETGSLWLAGLPHAIRFRAWYSSDPPACDRCRQGGKRPVGPGRVRAFIRPAARVAETSPCTGPAHGSYPESP